MVNGKTGERATLELASKRGVVMIKLGNWALALSPDEALELAEDIAECAADAEQYATEALHNASEAN